MIKNQTRNTIATLALISLGLFGMNAMAAPGFSAQPALACQGYPDQQFNNVLGQEMGAMINAIRCGDLRTALENTRRMQGLIANEIERNPGQVSETFGECFLDAKCTQRSGSTTPTRELCKASDGKGWLKTNPLPRGTCVKP